MARRCGAQSQPGWPIPFTAYSGEIINNFINYEYNDLLYLGEEETALCWAVYYLSLSGYDYLDTAIRYLSTREMEHDVFCPETLIPEIHDHYSGHESNAKFMLAMEMIPDIDIADTYLYEAFCDSTSGFRRWYDEGGKSKIPGLMQELKKLGFKGKREDSNGNVKEALQELIDLMYGSKTL